MIDSPYLVHPGKKFRLSDQSPDDTGDFKDKDEAIAASKKHLEKLAELQDVLYAQSKHSLLVVLQAIDAGGKDGTIDHVFSGVNPQGCSVTSFKVPSTLEKAHDFLWRIHAAVPPRGMIGIFNRSHYESVIVERIHKITSKDVWSKRYDHINNFEQMLVDENVVIVKFFLHISKKEQKRRMQSRLEDKSKNWKFSPADLAERAKWDQYIEAFDDALTECSTKAAPWYVIPANKKWFRNWAIGDILVRTLKSLDLKYPEPVEGLDKVVIK